MTKQYSRILADPRGDIYWVTINRPEDRNSIDSALMEELEQVLKEAEKTPARAIIFTGGGGVYFIGGADGIEMMQCSPEGALAFSIRIQKLFNRMEASPLILVAAINGLCFGGGFEFAMACDLRVASEEARIGLPEVKVGIIPGGGGTQRLPRLVGMGRAMEMILGGKLYNGREAGEMGLVHSVVSADQLLPQAGKMLEPIFRHPQHALSQAKKAVRSSSQKTLAAGLRVESEAFSRCFSNDYFLRLMRQQLREGTLKTTVRLSRRALEERKKKG
ncbi:MAG TPA: enoyl-CoA hydratase/isomerase family protein [Thermodesulfobacteriota bacterium]|nr:enoyl-CoA hydratase/isomerase family protein [Thermodesulfobacteriota bacterium]